MNVHVEVTQDDIAAGRAAYAAPETNRPAACPVARALNRVAGSSWEVLPSGWVKAVRSDGATGRLPEKVIRFAERFDEDEYRDDNRRIRPFSFDLNISVS